MPDTDMGYAGLETPQHQSHDDKTPPSSIIGGTTNAPSFIHRKMSTQINQANQARRGSKPNNSTTAPPIPTSDPPPKRFIYNPMDLLLPHERVARASSSITPPPIAAPHIPLAPAMQSNPPPYSSINQSGSNPPSIGPTQTLSPYQAGGLPTRNPSPPSTAPVSAASTSFWDAPAGSSTSINSWASAVEAAKNEPGTSGTTTSRASSWAMDVDGSKGKGRGLEGGGRLTGGSADAVIPTLVKEEETPRYEAVDERMEDEMEEEVDIVMEPSTRTDSPEDQRPAELSDWEVVETLGTGTFGRVLLVRLRPQYRSVTYHPIFPDMQQPIDPLSPSPQETAYMDSQLPHYAMKVLAKTEIVRLKQVEHINSERAILERVRHPFLVELYATYQDHLNVYMLLSYVPGGELFSHLRRAGRFTADVTRFYLSSIILAIDYLHSRDIIYRDLKPENLLLDRSGYLRIADFGFAKVVEDRTFTLCGTPEYLAPEIVLSKGHGKAVDWWALGILCFEMLAGYPPFFDDHPLGIYEKILANKVAFPSHIDAYAKDLIRRLLTADRSKRLGNLRGGAKDVMSHRWFTGVDWATLERREIGAPIVPHVASMGDSQNFQRYPPPSPAELPGLMGITPTAETPDPYKGLFTEFAFPRPPATRV